jgi:hypothetical protein
LDDEYIPIVCSIRGKNDAWPGHGWFAIRKGWGLTGAAGQQVDHYQQGEMRENLEYWSVCTFIAPGHI